MPMPVITVVGNTAGTSAATSGAIANMISRSGEFRSLLDAVGQRYQYINVYIGSGANAGHPDQASSGQDATNPAAWNVYIDSGRVDQLRVGDGTTRTPFVEELLAHEIGHGRYGGRELPIEHRLLIDRTDQIASELGLNEGGSSGAVVINLQGRPVQLTPTSPEEAAGRFGLEM